MCVIVWRIRHLRYRVGSRSRRTRRRGRIRGVAFRLETVTLEGQGFDLSGRIGERRMSRV